MQSLSVSPPRPEEVHLIHNLYLQSIKQRRKQGHADSSDLNSHEHQILSMLLNGEHHNHNHNPNHHSHNPTHGSAIASDLPDTPTSHQAASSLTSTGTATGSGLPKDQLVALYCSLQRDHSRWMKDTIYKSAQLMHVQVGVEHSCDLCS